MLREFWECSLFNNSFNNNVTIPAVTINTGIVVKQIYLFYVPIVNKFCNNYSILINKYTYLHDLSLFCEHDSIVVSKLFSTIEI